jgi:predicted transcriptional regulator of viral defense system
MTKAAIGAKEFLLNLIQGRNYVFTTNDAQNVFGTAESSTLHMLGRLRAKGLIVSPVRTFHAIVSPEYKAWGCLPPAELAEPLFSKMNLEYYVGLLSAAHLHGALEKEPMSFQVIVKKNRPSICSGKTNINFTARVNLENIQTQRFKSRLLPFNVSTPEATALDLVAYPHQVGGLAVVIKTLRQLALKLKARALFEQASRAGEMPHIQRLGLLLDQLDQTKLTGPLAEWVKKNDPLVTPLVPGLSKIGRQINERWRVCLNSSSKISHEL